MSAALRLCGYCQTWNGRPCGQGCYLRASDPTWEQLTSPDGQVETHSDCAALIRSKVVGKQKDLAAKLGISDAYLSQVLTGRKRPSDNILRRLGIERVTFYRDSDGTAPAAACEDMPVPDRTAKRGSARTSPKINRSNPHG